MLRDFNTKLVNLSPAPCAVPQADVTPITQYENVPEAGVASLFDRSMQPLRLVPGVHARGAQTALVGAEMLTSIPGGSRCADPSYIRVLMPNSAAVHEGCVQI